MKSALYVVVFVVVSLFVTPSFSAEAARANPKRKLVSEFARIIAGADMIASSVSRVLLPAAEAGVNFIVDYDEELLASEWAKPGKSAGASGEPSVADREALLDTARKARERFYHEGLRNIPSSARLHQRLRTEIDENFSAGELDRIVRFARTPAGKKAVEFLASDIGGDIVQEVVEEFQRDVLSRSGPNQLPLVVTLADLRSVATSVEAWSVDHGDRYPAANDIRALVKLISPKYFRSPPLVDGWGTEYRYFVSQDGSSYRLASAGSDRKFSPATLGIPAGESATENRDLAADIVYQNGEFLRYPKGIQRADP